MVTYVYIIALLSISAVLRVLFTFWEPYVTVCRSITGPVFPWLLFTSLISTSSYPLAFSPIYFDPYPSTIPLVTIIYLLIASAFPASSLSCSCLSAYLEALPPGSC
jgi:hypothetical protein